MHEPVQVFKSLFVDYLLLDFSNNSNRKSVPSSSISFRHCSKAISVFNIRHVKKQSISIK